MHLRAFFGEGGLIIAVGGAVDRNRREQNGADLSRPKTMMMCGI
jgi:hypothetical protein